MVGETKQLKKDGRLEKIIESDRFEILLFEPLGSGAWGEVYLVSDKRDKKERVVKVQKLNHIAKRQIKERNLEPFEAVKKEATELMACAHIVPRNLEFDNNGKPFIIMPKYDKFFSDILEEAKERPYEEGSFDSGLTFDEIIKFAGDIAKGIEEVHREYKKAHCDLKPDNFAVDEKGKILIADMGTSTYYSMSKWADDPRDRMGCMYVRSPKLYKQGSHPDKTADVFSFGSLLYMMFTGEYPLQKEIDQAMDEGGFGKANEKMEEFAEEFAGSNIFSHKYYETIESKIENDAIPEEFKEFIGKCLEERYASGTKVREEFEKALENYKENRIKNKTLKELKKKIKKYSIRALIGGIAASLFLTVATWLGYVSPKPNYSELVDIDSRLTHRPVEQSKVVFQIEEIPYDKSVKFEKTDKFDGYMSSYKFDVDLDPFGMWNEKSAVNKIIVEWIKTMNETNTLSKSDLDAIRIRELSLFPGRGADSMNSDCYFHRSLKTMLLYSISVNQIDKEKNITDLESALVTALLGKQVLDEAKDCVPVGLDHRDFNNYISARYASGEFVIKKKYQHFLKRLVYNVAKTIPTIKKDGQIRLVSR